MSYKVRKTSRSEKRSLNRPLFTSIVAVIAISFVLTGLEITDTTHLFHKKKLVSSKIPSAPSAKSSSSNESSTNNPSTQSDNPTTSNEKTVAPPTSGVDLLAPSGSLASNHRPSLKDSPGEESVCVTTPGAFCTIIFTKDGITKTLESKKADNSGIVTWNWDVTSAGFVEGSWKITATASLNGHSKSTTDLQNLEVQP